METTQRRLITIASACFATTLVIIIVVYNPFRYRSPLDDRPIYMLCTDCNHPFVMTHNEYYKVLQDKGAIGPGGPISPPPPIVCPACNKAAAFAAQKCDKCGNVFFPNPTAYGDYQDRCPKCRYSKAEERYKNR